MVKLITSIYCLLFFTLSSAWAQTPQLKSKLVPRSGTTEDQFQLSVTIEGVAQGGKPSTASNADFNINYIGPSVSYTNINGEIAQSITHIFALRPKHDGLLSTPEISIDLSGQKYSIPSIKVAVDKQTQGAIKGEVFLRQSVDKSDVLAGEQFAIYLDLYRQAPVFDPQLENTNFDGFWQEDLGDNEEFTRRENGINYNVLRIKKALYALVAGDFELPARILIGKLREHKSPSVRDPFDIFGRNLFDDFFGTGAFKEFRSESNSVKVKVSPPPPMPKSAWKLDNPIVGTTALRVEFDQDERKVGENAKLVLTLEGYGNLNAIKEVPIQSNDNYKVYVDNVESDKDLESERVFVQKKFTLSLVGIRPGKFELPDLSIPYLDPEDRTYRIATSEKLSFTVTGVSPPNEESPGVGTTQTAPLPEIKPVETFTEETPLEKIASRLSVSMATYAVLLLTAVLVLSIFSISKFTNKRRRIFLADVDGAASSEELAAVLLTAVGCPTFVKDPSNARFFVEWGKFNPTIRFKLQTLLDDLSLNSDELVNLRQRARELVGQL